MADEEKVPGTYYSPEGNPEVWDEKPDGYYTVQEWFEKNGWEYVDPNAPPTEEELEKERGDAFNLAIKRRLDIFAQEKGYDTIEDARLSSLSTTYHIDGGPANDAYDSMWVAAIALWPMVVSGQLSLEDAIAQLPVLTWPVQRDVEIEE